MIAVQLNVTSEIFNNSLSFVRLQCQKSCMQQISSVNYAEVRSVKIRKRNRILKPYSKGIEMTHHPTLQKRNLSDKLNKFVLNKFLCPEESFHLLQHRKKTENPESMAEVRPGVLLGNIRSVAKVGAVGTEAPRELEGDAEHTEVPSHHLEPMNFHQEECDSMDISMEEYDVNVQKLIKGAMERSCEKSSLYLKKTHNHNKNVLQKYKKVGSTTNKSHQKNDFHGNLTNSELAALKENLFQSVGSYVDACINCGILNHAMKALLIFREHCKQSDENRSSIVLDVRVFEPLLHGYAARKNISKVEELMKVMAEDGIVKTAQCYAACFECVARKLDECGNNVRTGNQGHETVEIYAKKKLRMWASEMLHNGLNLNDLFTKTCLLSDQEEMVMAAVLSINPDFQVVLSSCPELDYTCSLLEGIKALDFIMYHSPISGLVDCEQLKIFSSEQLQNEMKGYLNIKSIEHKHEPNGLVINQREKLAKCQEEWRQVILNTFSRDFQILRNCCKDGVITHRFLNIYPFLASVKKEELVELILQEIHKLAEESEVYSSTTNQLYRELGNQVCERYQVSWKKRTGIFDKIKDLHGKYCEWFSNPEKVILADKRVTCTRQAWQLLIHTHQNEGSSLNFREKSWPMNVQIEVGKYLYGIILNEIMIDINILKQRKEKCHKLPAFYNIFRPQKNGKMMKNEVKPHPVLVRLFRGASSDTLKFPTRCLPMLCPPVPWTTFMSGAYLALKTDFIRLPHRAALQWNHLFNCPPQQLYPAFDSLNQLGSVPWKINKPVLDVVMKVFNSGGSSQLDIPVPPSSLSSSCTNPELGVLSESEKCRLERHHLHLRKKKAEAYSRWCTMLYQLSVANHLHNRIFWLPHNMDFRGRVYPCPPHLNHLGSDVTRSLLCFAKGRPLGPRGFTWLKLHLVNLTGLKKRDSIKERMDFAIEIMPKVIDSAEKPLTGGMWWAKSDEPWQTLAVCMEISAALKAEGGPENYVCHFPVHQDGSCNGLQHYAALGRDRIGASSVSMTPSEYPEDVYTVVAAKIEQVREADARLGIIVAQKLEGFVHRKVIKQTVMTTVYGVTRYGARLQIARQLRDIDKFPKDQVWCASLYLVEKTFDCLREMFTSTKKIQDWFTDCAQQITKVCGQCVEWVTPLGLPVMQPYQHIFAPRKNGVVDPFSRAIIKVPFGCHQRPNVMKQKNAFPPNFIHSMDSCHMMLTSLWCERKGLTFVSVHDCYWTHPSTVEIMNRICREQFVSLHSQPILEDLSAFFIRNYCLSEEGHNDSSRIINKSKRKLNDVLSQVPEKGDFDLKSVLDSVYFFS
ncbi:DNA-directed RNA polymerase, mitochondrial-like [Hetaerina americana]|uniref:DNA-directed RNA polymerase, mitochondrial-like n=1 Tax=Hetaerina americana TaxID=62018 RepID=UPI003A7F5E2C